MEDFLKQLGIIPNRIKLFEIAMSHSSYANEHKDKRDYERLEFLGDAVLELVVTEYIYKNNEQDEGDMTKTRANYVCENANYEYMNKLGLIKFIRVGNGEVHDLKKAIVADIFEAFIGAIYLDQGFECAKKFILDVITPYIMDKTDLVDEKGPAHAKIFTIAVRIDGITYGMGTASSKKEACQLAAKEALERMARKV